MEKASIAESIRFIRGHKVLIDRDLADLYGVEVKSLNRQVRRNRERFPVDFMFQLTAEETSNLKCQIGTSSWGGDRRALPHAFTEQGVAMLSSVLRYDKSFSAVFAAIRALMAGPERPTPRIGFKP